jgi:hypothetical protein
MRNIFFTLGCVLVATLAGILIYIYNKPPRNVVAETGIPVTATELFTKFSTNEPQANHAYLNKVLQVSGQVLDVKHNSTTGRVVILNTGDPMFGIACTLNKPEAVTPGEKITVKGICTGYLSDVVLTNSYLVN